LITPTTYLHPPLFDDITRHPNLYPRHLNPLPPPPSTLLLLPSPTRALSRRNTLFLVSLI
jgi:hypothetical protein